ncbi:MAG TPA: hypothetical protein VJ914_03805 [Pseudonocardiaceae bacterium]|nr:hypothetical protein [Pseudonocardiaceae bacterium]
MSRYWLPAAVLAGAALVGGITACGGQSPTSSGSVATTAAPTTTAALTANDVTSAIQSASAVHVKGTMSDSGTNVALDVQLNKDGTASGTVGIGGPNYPIVLANKVVYIQFTPDVLKSVGLSATSGPGKTIVNKWVPSTSKLMANSDLASSVQPLLDYSQFTGSIVQSMPSGAMKPGKSDTVDGTPVQQYTMSDGTPADIATSSPHYLIRLLPGPTDGAGQLDFTNWNQPVAVTAPSASEIYTG